MSVRSGSATILVIDDDDLVREAVVELLQADNHRVLSSARGEDALAMLQCSVPT